MRGTLQQQVGEEHIREARLAFRNGDEISLGDVTVAFICISFARLGPNWTAVPSPAPSAP